MKIIVFSHPTFLPSQSMPKYANWIHNGMLERGHDSEIWRPKPYFYRLPGNRLSKKWLGYIDQYIIFPLIIKFKITRLNSNTIYVFTDQVLGPWVKHVIPKAHVIHCHDFLAQHSALDLIPQNPTSISGKWYQAYIRKGYRQGKNFISVSQKTEADLLGLLNKKPSTSHVVYNGLTQDFKPIIKTNAIRSIQNEVNSDLSNGYILHVGGNQWYKNRVGVIEIYNEWRKKNIHKKLPLLLIGEKPNSTLYQEYSNSLFRKDIIFLSGKSDEFVQKAYQGATVFLFPSLAEGFGWPIAEAMASGTLVITTEEPPMTEVASNGACFYIRKRPLDQTLAPEWYAQSATILDRAINLKPEELELRLQNGYNNIRRFDSQQALNKIETIYHNIINQLHG